MTSQQQFSIDAKIRTESGKAESRRLRRSGLVPAIIYGGKKDVLKLSVRHNEITHHLENEAFLFAYIDNQCRW